MEIWAPKKITLIKQQFDHLHLMRLHESSTPEETAKVAIMVMEEGIAHLYLLTNKTSMLKAKVEKAIPKNKQYNDQNKKAKERFYHLCLEAIENKLNLDCITTVVIGSPGFTKDRFKEYIE